MAAFPSLQPFPRARSPNELSAFSWFPLFFFLREEDKKGRISSNLLLLKAALSRLDFGPAYYEDPVSRTSSFSLLGSRGSYAAAFPGPFLLVLRPEAIA